MLGVWSISSKLDPRWDRNGVSAQTDKLVECCANAVEEVKRELGLPPPSDLEQTIEEDLFKDWQ